MRGVQFTRDMRPNSKGDTRLVPEEVAQRLIAEGAAIPYRFPKSPFSAGAMAQGGPEPSVAPEGGQIAKRGPGRPPKQSYLTK